MSLPSGHAGEPRRRGVAEAATLVLRATRVRAPTLGRGRLVCIDGPAGSGKSTLARALHGAGSAVGSAGLVHLDDLLDGWDGLDRVGESLERLVLTPLAAGRAGRYRRYDWHRGEFAEEHVQEPVDLLVVDGVGSGASSYATLVTTLVWVDAPAELRLARGLARDGENLRPQWLRWMAREERLFARERTQGRADLLLDGRGDGAPAVAGH